MTAVGSVYGHYIFVCFYVEEQAASFSRMQIIYNVDGNSVVGHFATLTSDTNAEPSIKLTYHKPLRINEGASN